MLRYGVTTTGALEDRAVIKIKNGELLDTDFVVHFPIAMKHAWDNVIYTCSVMLLFRDEAEVDGWCATRGIAKGDVRPIAQVWSFAADWYGHHADPSWTKHSTREAAEIFRRHDLDGPIWDLSPASDRF